MKKEHLKHAKKILKKFNGCANGAVGSDTLNKNRRRCALIFVKGIISEYQRLNDGDNELYFGSKIHEWRKIKEAILKLK